MKIDKKDKGKSALQYQYITYSVIFILRGLETSHEVLIGIAIFANSRRLVRFNKSKSSLGFRCKANLKVIHQLTKSFCSTSVQRCVIQVKEKSAIV